MILGNVLGHILSQQIFQEFDNSPHCPIDTPLTCRNETTIPDQCCFEYPGGIFLQSQFWNFKPSSLWLNETEIVRELGPIDSFTIHGLWPDTCIGTYEQFCRKDLFIDDVYHLLNSNTFPYGKTLYQDLDLLWKSNLIGNDESLWIHEFNKHGSCIRNIRPECYSRWNNLDRTWAKKQAVFDYFNVTVNLFKKLNTYQILQKNGIEPSINTTYSKSQIETALSKEFNDKRVFINCDRNNHLTEIWYFHLLNGSFINEKFVPIDALHDPPYSQCKETGIKYFPKGYSPTNNGKKPEKTFKRGTLSVMNSNENRIGPVSRRGRWLKSGKSANFKLIESPFGNYYLKSSLGYCSVQSETHEFSCLHKTSNEASQFEYDSDNNIVGYSGIFEWGSDEKPRRTKQGRIYYDGSNLTYNFRLKFESY